MVAVASPNKSSSSGPSNNGGFHPDEYRMTLGEHLEELRMRLFYGLAGYAIVLIVCFFYGEMVVSAFCAPLVKVLIKNGINPQLVTDEVGEGFFVYIQISMVTAAAVASPWLAIQVWKFIAAGLYPHERKYITKYMPLSVALLVSGMAFVYYVVLPWTLEFLIAFSVGITPMGIPGDAPPPVQINIAGRSNIPIVAGNPKEAANGDVWFDTNREQLKIYFAGKVRVIPFNSNNLIAAEIKLSTYIELVITSLLIFGLSFQLPLVVLAIERMGIVDIPTLKSGRRYVYFVLCIIAAVITPGGDIPSLLGLTIPLCGLCELGIWLAGLNKGPKGQGFPVD